MGVGERIRAARVERGLTQERVAALAGMHVSQYNGYERGRSRPAAETLARIASALSVESAELVGGAPESRFTNGDLDGEPSIRELKERLASRVATLLELSADDVVVKVELR
jgi:transcriptional regulator with XRE-family HTH domain